MTKPYPISLLLNARSEGLRWDILQPFLDDLRPQYLSIMQGESDADEGIARHMIAEHGSTIFHYNHVGENFFKAVTPAAKISEYRRKQDAILKPLGMSTGHVIHEVFREHGTDYDFNEQVAYVRYMRELSRIGFNQGVQISAGGLPTGRLTKAHIDSGVYDPLFNPRYRAPDEPDSLVNVPVAAFSEHGYVSTSPVFHDPTPGKFPTTLDAIIAALHWDNWPNVDTMPLSSDSFLARLPLLINRTKHAGYPQPIWWLSEFGLDNLIQHKATRDLLQARFGLPDGFTELRGINTYRRVVEGAGIHWDDWVYHLLDWFARFWTKHGVSSLHLFIWEFQHNDGNWALGGFNVADIRDIILQHKADWDSRTEPAPPSPPTIPPTNGDGVRRELLNRIGVLIDELDANYAALVKMLSDQP